MLNFVAFLLIFTDFKTYLIHDVIYSWIFRFRPNLALIRSAYQTCISNNKSEHTVYSHSLFRLLTSAQWIALNLLMTYTVCKGSEQMCRRY